MKTKSKRQINREKRRKKQVYTTFAWGGAALVVIALVGSAVLSASRPSNTSANSPTSSSSTSPAAEEAVTVMPDTRHVPEGTDPGPYNSDPPTSGRHYANTLKAGFYNEGDIQADYPVGYLVHNLEHGYVIFWYNCSLVSEDKCSTLKGQIKQVLEDEKNIKVIAYPWSSTDVPVVMTSWGRMLRMESFDAGQARDFVVRNRYKAPEPDVP